MTGAPTTEPGRLADPRRVAIVRSILEVVRPDDADLSALVSAARHVADCEYAFLAFLDADCHRIICAVGLPMVVTDVVHTACRLIVEDEDKLPLIIGDLHADRRVRDLDAVRRSKLSFYAGFPVVMSDTVTGTLVVSSPEPRSGMPEETMSVMRNLAGLVSTLLTHRVEENVSGQTATTLASTRHRHDLALKAARIATWIWNRETDTIEADGLFTELLGLSSESRLSVESVLARIDVSHRDRIRSEIRGELDAQAEFSVEAPIGGSRTVALYGRVLDPDRPSLVNGVMIDVSERQMAETKRRELLRELNHRVRNTLAMLQSIAGQTLRRSASADEFASAFSGRLQALSNAHHLLTEQDWQAISVQALLRQQMDPLLGGRRTRVAIDGDDGMVGPDEAVGLALVLHELTTNALRHGAIRAPEGRIDVRTDTIFTGERHIVRIRWQERGLDMRGAGQEGFGLQIIRRSLDKIIGSSVSVDWTDEGVSATLAVPAFEGVRPAVAY